MKTFIREYLNRILIGLAFFIILWFLYTALVSIPREALETRERMATTERRTEMLNQISRESSYTTCKANSHKTYSNDWDSKCETIGKKADCVLFAYQYEIIEERYNEKLDKCLSIYKAN